MTDEENELVNSILNGIEEVTLDNELDELNEQLAQLEMDKAAEEQLLSQHEKEIEAVRQRFNAELAALNNQNRELKERRFDRNRDILKLKQKQESIKRQIEATKLQEQKEQQYKNLEVKWDEVFNNLADAFPHQLEGAKRMAYSGTMLLADTMGLGKTRTALIACDLIQSMTNETDTDHPYVIED